MEEINKIIEGYNQEKLVLINTLCKLENRSFESSKQKADDIEKRLAIVDKKIEDIQARLFTPTHPNTTNTR